MSESRLNIELFKKIRERIATIPESYDQSVYVARNAIAPCGTVACLAGEAIICAAATVEKGIRDLHMIDAQNNVSQHAANLLGLPRPNWNDRLEEFNASARMFHCSNAYDVYWPEPFASDFRDARTDVERSAVAVAYLDHIIETGKVLE